MDRNKIIDLLEVKVDELQREDYSSGSLHDKCLLIKHFLEELRD